MNNVESTVIEILVEICATKKVRKDWNLDLINSGYMDSMGIVELLTELEDEFGIEISLDEFVLSELNTVNKIIEYVKKNIEK